MMQNTEAPWSTSKIVTASFSLADLMNDTVVTQEGPAHPSAPPCFVISIEALLAPMRAQTHIEREENNVRASRAPLLEMDEDVVGSTVKTLWLDDKKW